MTTLDIDRLVQIFRAVLNQPTLELRDDLTARDVATWDSFNHINLILQIEQEFGIRFSHTEVSGLRNVGELKTLISAKRGTT